MRPRALRAAVTRAALLAGSCAPPARAPVGGPHPLVERALVDEGVIPVPDNLALIKEKAEDYDTFELVESGIQGRHRVIAISVDDEPRNTMSALTASKRETRTRCRVGSWASRSCGRGPPGFLHADHLLRGHVRDAVLVRDGDVPRRTVEYLVGPATDM
jgi:hypothetical protein